MIIGLKLWTKENSHQFIINAKTNSHVSTGLLVYALFIPHVYFKYIQKIIWLFKYFLKKKTCDRWHLGKTHVHMIGLAAWVPLCRLTVTLRPTGTSKSNVKVTHKCLNKKGVLFSLSMTCFNCEMTWVVFTSCFYWTRLSVGILTPNVLAVKTYLPTSSTKYTHPCLT